MKTNPNPAPVNLLIADRHCVIREGLKAMLQSLHKEIRFIVTAVDSGEKALQVSGSIQADILLLDHSIVSPMDGAETIRRTLRYKPTLKVLVFSHDCEHGYVEAMMNAGAGGYLLQNARPPQLLEAIEAVLEGKKYYCHEVALMMLTEAKKPVVEKLILDHRLSRREVEVLRMIGKGKSNKEIAQGLFVSSRTVDTHRQHLLEKLKLHSTAALVRVAIEWGLA